MSGANGQGIEFSQRELSANDFDGTIALTSEQAPNGMTVASAYEAAVMEVLGESALARYQAEGGLHNRAPSEVVIDLSPGLDEPTARQKTEDLIEAKLAVLSAQVGQRLADGSYWPRPTEGFTTFWAAVSACPTVDTAIVSSGHDDFINRFYEVHELQPPDVMVTDDDMRPLMAYTAPDLCVKPSPLLIDLAHVRWLEMHGQEVTQESIQASQQRIIYAGDDPNKDGLLAEYAGIDFIHIDPADTTIGWRGLSQSLLLGEIARA